MTTRFSRRSLLGAAGGLAGAMLGGCQFLGLQWRYRYRLTATLVSENATITGSSVIQVVRNKGYNVISGRIDGEAPVVDIPGRVPLFVLLVGPDLSPDWPRYVPHEAFSGIGLGNSIDTKALDRLVDMEGTSAKLSVASYPKLATFRDINDPGSIVEVHPDAVPLFYPGFRLADISIQMTRDRVSRSILQRLPWLAHHRGALLAIDPENLTAHRPFAQSVNTTALIQGPNA